MKKIISFQRDFFRDHDWPFFLVSTIQDSSCTSIGGTHFFNAQACRIGDKSDPEAIALLLCHEHLHNWLGQKIKAYALEGHNPWWSEGFTEYLAHVMAYRLGLLQLSTLVEAINRNLFLYQDGLTTGTALSPYISGFVMALCLDHTIRRNTAYTQNLDNFMRLIFNETYQKNKELTQDIFFKSLKKMQSEEFIFLMQRKKV